MTELIHYSFDALRLGGLAVRATDEVGSYDVSIPSGELCHVAMAAAVDHRGNSPARLAAIETLAARLTTELNAAKLGGGDWYVSYQTNIAAFNPFYTVGYDNFANFAIDFREVTVGAAGPRLARAMGLSSSAPFVSDNSELFSTLRPYYLLIPAALCRTKVTPDRYDASIATDARTDGGVHGQTAVARSAIPKEWTQAGEDELAIAGVAFNEPGTPVHAFRATAAIPWSYQHAWDHALSYKCAIHVDDGHPASPPEVVEMRADGLSFAPTYTGADDYPMHSIEYRVRLLGRILS